MLILLAALVFWTGCTINVDSPQTPTIAVSPTQDETAIARLATPTPSVTPSSTTTATHTLEPTLTATATITDTVTATLTLTHTITSSATPTTTKTYTPTSTATSTVTHTATETIAPTATKTYTPTEPTTVTATSSSTASPSATYTPTAPIIQLVIPTATPGSTKTFTPFPTVTPLMISTKEADHIRSEPSPSRTPGGIYTLTPLPTPPPTLTPVSATGTVVATASEGTFFDPNAPADGAESLPVAPVGNEERPSGPAISEQNSIVISYAGQIMPIVVLPDGIGTGSAITQGRIFAMNSSGQVAVVTATGELAVNNSQLMVSPASEFGLNENLSYSDLAWSDDGRFLAIRVDATNPHDSSSFESGIWIYEPATNSSWQIFRNTYEGQVEQLHEQHRALRAIWAPNSAALAITVETPVGLGTVFLPVKHSANDWVNAIPYADATWANDSTALIVSGQMWDGPNVIGRITLDTTWTYTEYLNQRDTGLAMQAAIQLQDRRIVFLGSTAASFALYAVPPVPGEQPIRLTAPITGQIVTAEWNTQRTAVLVTVKADNQQQLWVAHINGTISNSTLPGIPIDVARWR